MFFDFGLFEGFVDVFVVIYLVELSCCEVYGYLNLRKVGVMLLVQLLESCMEYLVFKVYDEWCCVFGDWDEFCWGYLIY